MSQNTYTGSGKIQLPNNKKIIYEASQELLEAVNIALLINRPLLVMGEPGVGKTQLAKAVASEWYGSDFEKHYFEWFIKSSTKADEGFYRYDALRRLNDAQIFKDEKSSERIQNTTLGNEGSYFQYGVLSEAIQQSKIGQRSVLLIDEIDKADIDFPNDLLHILDKFEFTIPETGQKIKKPKDFLPPLVIITSNQEKDLPVAFLRRCIYFYIDFPKEPELIKILASHFGGEEYKEDLKFITEVFLEIRVYIEKKLPSIEKKISTSELVDWFQIIDELRKKEKRTAEEKKLLDKANNWLTENRKDDFRNIPFYQVLFKNIESRKLFAANNL